MSAERPTLVDPQIEPMLESCENSKFTLVRVASMRAREITTYFPQPGDGPQVIKQKGDARAIATNAMRDAAGPAIPKDLTRSPGNGGPVSGGGWKIEKVE